MKLIFILLIPFIISDNSFMYYKAAAKGDDEGFITSVLSLINLSQINGKPTKKLEFYKDGSKKDKNLLILVKFEEIKGYAQIDPNPIFSFYNQITADWFLIFKIIPLEEENKAKLKLYPLSEISNNIMYALLVNKEDLNIIKKTFKSLDLEIKEVDTLGEIRKEESFLNPKIKNTIPVKQAMKTSESLADIEVRDKYNERSKSGKENSEIQDLPSNKPSFPIIKVLSKFRTNVANTPTDLVKDCQGKQKTHSKTTSLIDPFTYHKYKNGRTQPLTTPSVSPRN
jgi:hypothetical protein